MLDPSVDRSSPEETCAPLQRHAAPHCERPFVGREAELAELSAGLDAAFAGEGRLFLVSGEAGIGKTRLAAELTRVARARGALVAWGRCWEAGGAPSYWPWVEVLRQLVASPGCPEPAHLGRTASYLVQIVPDLQESLGGEYESAPLPTDPDSARFLQFDAVATFLRAFTATRPLVVILDDIHAADRASLLLLAFLARAFFDERVLLVGTCRTLEARPLGEILEPLARMGRRARRRLLNGLTKEAVALLVEHVVGSPASDSLVTTIHATTDGNPFFIDELLTLMAAEGQLTGNAAPTSPIAVPDGIRDAVRLRLAALPQSSLTALEIAAVQGREFDAVTIAEAARQRHRHVLDALSEAIRHGLIVQRDAPGAFLFRHALIREVLYEQLSLTRRMELHYEIGQALQARSLVSSDRSTELAHHFLASAPICGDAFLAPAMHAAKQAFAQMAFEAAVELYERTIANLAYASPDHRRECELLIELGSAQEWAGDAKSSRTTFDRAATIARNIDATDLFVRVALGVGAVGALKYTAISRCDSATELLNEALARISPDDVQSRARLLSRLALAGGAQQDAMRMSADAIEAARASQDPTTLAHALTARHGVLYGPDFLTERCAIADEMLALASQTGSRELALRGYALRITDLVETSDVAAVDKAVFFHGRLADETGDPFERWANLVWRSLRASSEGLLDQAERLATRAFRLADDVPGLHREELYAPVTFLGQMFFIKEMRGEASLSKDVVSDYQRRFPEMPIWTAAPVRLAMKAGDLATVRYEIDRLASNDFGDLPRTGSWLAAMLFLAEGIHFANDRTRAAALYPLLLPYKDRLVTVSVVSLLGPMARALGLIADTLGYREAAARHFETAIELCTRMRAFPHIAFCLYDYARFAHKHGHASPTRQPQVLAQDALRIAQSIGMRPLINDIEALVQRLHGTIARRPQLPDSPRFDRNGDVWSATYAGDQIHLSHTKGLLYIAELVRKPGQDIHVLDLLGQAGVTRVYSAQPRNVELERAGRRNAVGTRVDDVLDSRTRRAYRKRLSNLQDELESAQACGDPEQTLALRDEIAALQRELKRSVGLHGRTRHSSVAERARISVTRTIRLALTRIARAAPKLGEHLARSIRTGTFCSYMPGSSSAASEAMHDEEPHS